LLQTFTAQEAIGADIGNIRLAWEWASERAEAAILERMLEGLARWHELQGFQGQAAETLEQAAERLRAALAPPATPDPTVQRLLGFVLVQEAMALIWQGSYPHALPLLEEAGELARVTASLHLEGRVAYGLGWLFGRQRDLHGGVQWLQQALALARAAQQYELEADSLNAMGLADMLAGEYSRAHSYLERALAFYRAQHNRLGEMEISHDLGIIASARGDFAEAQRLFQAVLQATRVVGSHQIENVALHGLGLVQDEGWGRHIEAESFFAQDLRLTQEIGDRTREGFALAALGRNALYQGDLERAGTLFDQALGLSRQVTSRESAAMALRGQSLLAHYQGDDWRARLCAEEALEVARTAGMRRHERLALRLLGHALLGLGEWTAAAAYEQAANLDEQLGFPHFRVETATDLARVALAEGDIAQAVALVAPVVPDLEQATPAGLEEPALAYLTCYRVLRAAGDARADGVLAAGHAFLQKRAAQFVDEGRRSRFLGNLAAHRELLDEWRARGGWIADAREPGATISDVPRPIDVGRRPRLRVVGSE
jgi:tetratricopeptide (TPR) repeat protein